MADYPEAPLRVRFCQRCGGAMKTGEYQQKKRRICTECGHIHFVEPRIAVGAMVLRNGAVLLVQRKFAPEKRKWCLPGGYLDPGELPEDAARREVMEETGLTVRIGELEAVYGDASGRGAAVTLIYNADSADGDPVPADDALDARFCPIDAIPPLAFASTEDIVARARARLAPPDETTGARRTTERDG